MTLTCSTDYDDSFFLLSFPITAITNIIVQLFVVTIAPIIRVCIIYFAGVFWRVHALGSSPAIVETLINVIVNREKLDWNVD